MRADDELPEHLHRLDRQILRPQQPGPRRVVDVVVDVGNEIRHAHDLSFDRARAQRLGHPDRRAGLSLRVLGDAVAHFPGEVQPSAVVLEQIDDAKALFVVVEAAGHERVDHAFAGMAERRVAEVVTERDRFGQLFVQPQDFGDRARDLRHLERVRQPRAVVIAGRREEHLRLVLQPAERLAVDDAIAIALERRPHFVFGLRTKTAARVGALGRLRREDVALARFELLADRHRLTPVCAGAAAISARKLVPCASGTHAEHLGERLTEVGKRRARAQVALRPERGRRRRAAARTRANDRCWRWSDRCRGRP